MRWTDDQRQIIETGTRNMLVSAAAGSGKTAVLVQRVIDRLIDSERPVDIDRFLIVTFTNAAAAQMKERIGRRLETEIERLKDELEQEKNQPDPLKTQNKSGKKKALHHLEKQLRLLPLSHISTLHSFCTTVLREHFQELDIEPGFRAGEEGELTLLKKKAIEDTLEQFYQLSVEQPDSDESIRLRAFIDHYSPGKSDLAIENMMTELADIALQEPFPFVYLDELERSYASPSEAKRISHILYQLSRHELAGITGDIRDRLNFWAGIAETVSEGVKIKGVVDTLSADLERFAALESIEDQNQWLAAFYQLDFVRMGSISGPKTKAEEVARLKAYSEADKQLRAEYKGIYEKVRKLHPLSSAEVEVEFARLAPHVHVLSQLTKTYLEQYTANKRAKGLIDFDDMEHLALQILWQPNETDGRPQPTAAALAYRDFFAEIMVDEYQDSNGLQEAILDSLTKPEGNRMMVGDVKQSIYRFRQARPELFREKMDHYDIINGLRPSEEQRQVTILLNKNFRSRPQVLDSANAVFRHLMRRDIGGIDYDDKQALVNGACFPIDPAAVMDYKTEVFLVDATASDGTKPAVTADEAQAQWIAGEILRLQKEGWVYDDELQQYRRPQNRDFAVLMRSPSNKVDAYVSILSANDLYVATEKRSGYFSAIEIQDMLAYLYSLHNPQRDIDFVTVLTSPMVGLDHNELAKLRIAALKHKEKPTAFATAARLYAAEQKDDLAAALQSFFTVFDELRRLVRHIPVSELLIEVLDRTGYRHILSADRQAQRKLGNIRILINKAKGFDSSGNMGLFSFLHYIKQLKKYKEDFAEAMEGAKEQAISLMSIHKSKGLEFPFVFVTDLGGGFRNEGQGEAIVYHHNWKIGLDIIDREGRTKTASAMKNLINYQNTAESRGEEQRILYVAMTRAKEKLYLVGAVKKWQSQESRWKLEGERLDREKPDGQSAVTGSADGGLPAALSKNSRLGTTGRLDWLMPVVFSQAGSEHFYLTVKPIDSPDFSVPLDIRSEVTAVAAGTEVTEMTKAAEVEAVKTAIGSSVSDSSSKEERALPLYPYLADTRIPAKVSVSYLKHLQLEEDDQEAVLRFDVKRYWQNEQQAARSEKKLHSGPLYGTAFHRLMECLDYQKLQSVSDQAEYLAQLVEALAVHEHWDERLDLAALQKEAEVFVKSDTGRAMAAAALRSDLYREHDFIIGVAARELDGSWDSDEVVLVQGVIDACYRDKDGYHIVDYKTDHAPSMEELKELYQVQLQLYAQAWRQLTGEEVVDCHIYSTVFRDSISV
ncbi:MAG: helicase-exonuclease AddAB subunit AddA [Eubacteriales bacterium]|nr:helicase-exonuclease AddAB subunit AddA [Eubacteriales bacterium]